MIPLWAQMAMIVTLAISAIVFGISGIRRRKLATGPFRYLFRVRHGTIESFTGKQAIGMGVFAVWLGLCVLAVATVFMLDEYTRLNVCWCTPPVVAALTAVFLFHGIVLQRRHREEPRQVL